MSLSQPFAKRGEQQAQTSDMLLRLLRVARGAGVRISVAESIDAFESANAVGFADRQVLKAIDGPIEETVPAKRAITLRDLLTFRLGLGAVMVFPSRYPIQHAMEAAGIAPGPHPAAHQNRRSRHTALQGILD